MLTPLTHELVSWADIIFVMERRTAPKASLRKARVICLDIPDDYEFMDPGLMRLLEARVSKYLG
ncbi:putative protein tyrosine phosphatase [Mesorhizobium robiniae]|uniref:Protein-tyrosine-phosphatase n=1 Tax=Mesorhizobium robiniae TaxID=559315 RepID=A0ABV2GL15_9HYPH